MGQEPGLQAGGDGRPRRQLTLAGATVELWLAGPFRPTARARGEERDATAGERVARESAAQATRRILGARLGVDPDEVGLGHDERGAPLLDPGMGEERLSLSISHTGPWLALALARGVDVGVDIELRDRRVRAGVIERVLTVRELRALPGGSAEERAVGFLRHWTLKEACAKALGTGLGASLDRLEIDDALGEPRPRDPELADLALCSWDPLPQLIGALAARPRGD